MSHDFEYDLIKHEVNHFLYITVNQSQKSLFPVRMTAEEYLNGGGQLQRSGNIWMGRLCLFMDIINENDEIIGMVGALLRHHLLSPHVIAEVEVVLRSKPYRVYSVNINVKAGKIYIFPDATIICGN